MPTRALKADRLLKNARIIIPAGFLLLLIAAIAVVIGLVRSRDADQMVVHTLEVQQSAQSLLIDVRDAETNKRSFLLTGTPDYMEAFGSAMQAIPEEFDRLRTLSSDNPEQRARVAELGKLIDAKLDELRRTHALIQQGKPQEALAILNTTGSRQLINDIRENIAAVIQAESKLLAERQTEAKEERYLLAFLIGLALISAALLSGLLAFSTLQSLRGLIARTKELETESKLRQEAESTLFQAQKMEAVGQLTGGIAHDFNNLLTIILGNLDTVRRYLADLAKNGAGAELRAKLTQPVDAAVQGAKSAAQLTQRLLAFSRRQTLEPGRIDANRLVSGMLDMLKRTLGADISIETVLGAGVWPTFADPHQLENALLNLALNAKDAMPNGGHLTIETANTYLDAAYVRRFGDVEAGQYVVLCVTDTGTGIPKEILDHVFEPFFTTKPIGQGSGLGLAMVHGFVKQSGGHMRIYSEEGEGTTVKIYLPRLTNAEEVSAAPAGKQADVSPVPHAQNGETILIVEDNEGVRDYAKEVLGELGYAVLEAGNANQALEVLARARRVDLLFTDVVLPGGANGRELANRARSAHPSLPVLYTTGYTRNAIVHQGRLDADVELLNKPYTQQDLARKVRDMLDA